MAAVTLISEATRGNFTSGTFAVPGGAPRHVQLKMVSSAFPTDPTLTFTVQAQKSPDGIQPFVDWFGGTSVGGLQGLPVGKGGAISDGLYVQTVQFDGVACVVKATITVGPTSFDWGLTAEVLST